MRRNVIVNAACNGFIRVSSAYIYSASFKRSLTQCASISICSNRSFGSLCKTNNVIAKALTLGGKLDGRTAGPAFNELNVLGANNALDLCPVVTNCKVCDIDITVILTARTHRVHKGNGYLSCIVINGIVAAKGCSKVNNVCYPLTGRNIGLMVAGCPRSGAGYAEFESACHTGSNTNLKYAVSTSTVGGIFSYIKSTGRSLRTVEISQLKRCTVPALNTYVGNSCLVIVIEFTYPLAGAGLRARIPVTVCRLLVRRSYEIVDLALTCTNGYVDGVKESLTLETGVGDNTVNNVSVNTVSLGSGLGNTVRASTVYAGACSRSSIAYLRIKRFGILRTAVNVVNYVIALTGTSVVGVSGSILSTVAPVSNEGYLFGLSKERGYLGPIVNDCKVCKVDLCGAAVCNADTEVDIGNVLIIGGVELVAESLDIDNVGYPLTKLKEALVSCIFACTVQAGLEHSVSRGGCLGNAVVSCKEQSAVCSTYAVNAHLKYDISTRTAVNRVSTCGCAALTCTVTEGKSAAAKEGNAVIQERVFSVIGICVNAECTNIILCRVVQ